MYRILSEMEDYIAIATLNDFIFCPYSIYLHSVYMDADADMYKAVPQLKGTASHEGVDKGRGSTRATDLFGMSVYSEELGICGKIDVYKQDKELLIERKYNLKRIFQGQIYQLWAQYFCMQEMGFGVKTIAFYEISTNKMTVIPLPMEDEKRELLSVITDFKSYRPLEDVISINPNKCIHCIYCNLCDKTMEENVYV